MFSKPNPKPESALAIHSLMGKGMLWKGEMHCGSHSLRIEGTVDGTIHSEGEVTVAPTGVVTGTIHAKHLIVTGTVHGTFRIEECLEIHGTGCVEGDVEMGSLVVDEGGTLQGSCSRRGLNRPTLAHTPKATLAEFCEETNPGVVVEPEILKDPKHSENFRNLRKGKLRSGA